MHDLQLFDATFMEISGGPFPLHRPPFSGVQNYKFNIFSAYHTNSLAHLRRALYMECTLGCREGVAKRSRLFTRLGTQHSTDVLFDK